MKKKLLLSIFLSLFLISPFFADKWYVCLSSFRVLDNAVNLQNQLKDKNIDNVIVEYPTDNGILYRVFIDQAFDSRDVARNYINTAEKYTKSKGFNFSGLWICSKSDSNKIVILEETEDFEDEEESPFEFETIIEDEGPDYYWLSSKDYFFDEWIVGTWEGHFVYKGIDSSDDEDEIGTVQIFDSNPDSDIKGWNGGTLSDFIDDIFDDIEYVREEEGYISGDNCFYLTEDENTFSIRVCSEDNSEYFMLYEFNRK